MQSLARVEPNIYLAIELSASTWLVAARLPGSDKIGMHRMDAGDTAALARRAKTDRLDAQGLLRVLTAYHQGERHVCNVVRVPTPNERPELYPPRLQTWNLPKKIERGKTCAQNWSDCQVELITL